MDRNSDCRVFADVVAESLSARRAWIEMRRGLDAGNFAGGRSPQGERG